jgi:hypothetical protein
MSKYNNVNPGQYKVGGRERPDTIAKVRLKSKPAASPTTAAQNKRRRATKPTRQTRSR